MVTPILQLKAIGIDNVVRFDFVSPPPADHIREALQVTSSSFMFNHRSCTLSRRWMTMVV